MTPEETTEEKEDKITIKWPKKNGVRNTTLNLPKDCMNYFKAPAPEDFKVKFYDRSNSTYQKQIYLNGKYLSTAIAPTKDHQKNIKEVLFILMGIGVEFDEIKRLFKSIFGANNGD